jgi:hypothetical protein
MDVRILGSLYLLFIENNMDLVLNITEILEAEMFFNL